MSDHSAIFAQFETLLVSVLIRLYERRQADAAFARLMATHAEAKLLSAVAGGLESTEEPLRSLLRSHAKISDEGFRQLEAEYSRDMLIVP